MEKILSVLDFPKNNFIYFPKNNYKEEKFI